MTRKTNHAYFFNGTVKRAELNKCDIRLASKDILTNENQPFFKINDIVTFDTHL